MVTSPSVLLQNIPPAVLVRFLREHRSEWADFNVDAYSAASLKAGSYAYPGMRPTRFTGSQIIMPLGHTIEHEEVVCIFIPATCHIMSSLCHCAEANMLIACVEVDAYLLWAKIWLPYMCMCCYPVE